MNIPGLNQKTHFVEINLSELLEQLGEDNAKAILSSFSCPLNADVEKFLKDQIGFYDIPYYIEKSLNAHNSIINPKLDDILEVDRWARSYINDLLK